WRWRGLGQKRAIQRPLPVHAKGLGWVQATRRRLRVRVRVEGLRRVKATCRRLLCVCAWRHLL
ncbi:MAG TPA: hypothetical protein VHX63_01580, partial [Acidobacteriaceae bacterium]|nr:hypothetical protein [Acidobacteriaceae bacterium]